jgi:hypothetical protein
MRGLTLVLLMPLPLLMALSCTTSYMEFQGECVTQEWALSSIMLRRRQICDLPAPNMVYKDQGETAVSDREAMNVNPFPDLVEGNPADSMDKNLLEKRRTKNLINNSTSKLEVEALVAHYNTLGGTPLDVNEVLIYKGMRTPDEDAKSTKGGFE